MQRQPHKIRNLLLGSAFILVTSIYFVESANAEPIVAVGLKSSCLINKESDGALGANATNTVLSSLDTENGGSPGIIKIDCLGSADISVSAPIRDGGNGKTDFLASGLSATATSTELGLNINNNSANPQNLSNDPFGQIKVDMTADNNGQQISPGQYKFKVILTVAPD